MIDKPEKWSLGKKMGAFFLSLRLTIPLISLLILAALIGGIIPQAPSTPQAEAIYRSYGPFWEWLIVNLGWNDVFHSWWFLSLVGLFSFHLVFCMSWRISKSIRFFRILPSSIPNIDADGFERQTTQKEEELVRILKRRSFQVRRLGKTLLVERHRLGIIWPDLIHLGVVVVIIGALLSVFNQEGILFLQDGEKGKVFSPSQEESTNFIKGADFSLKVSDFGFDVYPQTQMPKDYWSTVAVFEGGEEVLTKRIQVNDPLDFRGFSFYLEDLGLQPETAELTLELVDAVRGETIESLPIKVGEEKVFSNSGIRLKLVRFFPSFRLINDQPRDMGYLRPDNPVALVTFPPASGGQTSFQYISDRASSIPGGSFSLLLSDYSIPTYVLIGYSRDPGYPLIWIGFSLLALAIFAALFFPYRRLWLLHTAQGIMIKGEKRVSSWIEEELREVLHEQ